MTRSATPRAAPAAVRETCVWAAQNQMHAAWPANDVTSVSAHRSARKGSALRLGEAAHRTEAARSAEARPEVAPQAAPRAGAPPAEAQAEGALARPRARRRSARG